MGISAGTALGEAMIDNGKDTAKTNQVQDLTAEKQALEQSITQTQAELDAINPAASTHGNRRSNRDALNRQLTDSRTRLGQIDQQLRTLQLSSHRRLYRVVFFATFFPIRAATAFIVSRSSPGRSCSALFLSHRFTIT